MHVVSGAEGIARCAKYPTGKTFDVTTSRISEQALAAKYDARMEVHSLTLIALDVVPQTSI